MTIRTAFQLAMTIVSGALVVLILGIVATKAVRQRLLSRRARLVAEVRPIVLDALDDGHLSEELTGRRRAAAELIAITLLPNLRGDDRAALARMLVESGFTDRAMNGLESRSAARRQRSIELLGTAGHLDAVEPLSLLLDDRDRDVRAAAGRALGRIGDERCVSPLFDALDRRRVPANTIAMAVLRVGPKGAEAIGRAMNSDEATTRSVATELAGSLGMISLRGAIDVLLDDASPTVRTSAARSLGRLGLPASVPRMIDSLAAELVRVGDDRRDDVAVALAVSLGQIGDRSAIPVLENSLMRNRKLSAAAGQALADMGQRRSHAAQRDAAPDWMSIPPTSVDRRTDWTTNPPRPSERVLAVGLRSAFGRTAGRASAIPVDNDRTHDWTHVPPVASQRVPTDAALS